jgi:rubrerythrin
MKSRSKREPAAKANQSDEPKETLQILPTQKEKERPRKKNASPQKMPEIKQVLQSPKSTEKEYKSKGQSLQRVAGTVVCSTCNKMKVIPKQDGTCPSCQSKIM